MDPYKSDLTLAERKKLRATESVDAMKDYRQAEDHRFDTMTRLRAERMARERKPKPKAKTAAVRKKSVRQH